MSDKAEPMQHPIITGVDEGSQDKSVGVIAEVLPDGSLRVLEIVEGEEALWSMWTKPVGPGGRYDIH